MKKILSCIKVPVELALLVSALGGCFSGCVTPDPVDVTLELGKQRVFIATTPFELTGGCPAGGRYEGRGVVGNRFSPEIAGVGTHEIVYTVSNVSATNRIEVFGARRRRSNPNCSICSGSGLVNCDPRIPCGSCGANGRIVVGLCLTCEGRGQVRAAWKLWLGTKECSSCHGAGVRYSPCESCKGLRTIKCPRCKGTGKAVCGCKK